MCKRIFSLWLILFVVWIPETSQAVSGATYEEIQGGLADKASELVFFWADSPIVVSERCGSLAAVRAGSSTDLGSIGSSKVDCSQHESAGLIGLASQVMDGDQGYLYTYYTAKGAAPKQHHVVRFGVSKDGESITINWSDKQVIVDELPAFQPQNGGGGLALGPDDSLYIGVGHDGNTNGVQDVTKVNGKILRVMWDGSTPSDNPTFSGSNPLETLFALGVQRPTSLAVDSETGHLWVGEVGSDLQEVNQGIGGENFGWPVYEGDKLKQPSVPLTGDSHTEPMYSFSNVGPSAFGGVVIGAPYHVTNGEFQLPSSFTGSIPLAGFHQSWFRMLKSVDGGWESVEFDGVSVNKVKSIATGPDGAIYFIEANKKMLSRVAWTDTKPTASIDSPAPTYRYGANETLSLQGSASDAEDGDLAEGFVWEITLRDADGKEVDSTSTTGKDSEYTLPDTVDINGSLTIQLTVSDSAGTSGSATVELSPAATKITYSTVPETGVVVTLDGEEIEMPLEKMYSAGTVISVSCPPETVLGDEFELYVFDNWSDGGEPSHDFIVPEEDMALVCTMRKHGPPPTSEPPVNVVQDGGNSDAGSTQQTKGSGSSGCRVGNGSGTCNLPIVALLLGFLLWRRRRGRLFV